jgi:hypothetical protein
MLIVTDWLNATSKGSLASVQRLIDAKPGWGCSVTSLRPLRIEIDEIVLSAYVVVPPKVTVGYGSYVVTVLRQPD